MTLTVATLQVYAAGQSLVALNSGLPVLDNSTSSGRVRMATAVAVSSLAAASRHTFTSNAHHGADVSYSASRFTVVCTLSESLGRTVIKYVSVYRSGDMANEPQH